MCVCLFEELSCNISSTTFNIATIFIASEWSTQSTISNLRNRYRICRIKCQQFAIYGRTNISIHLRTFFIFCLFVYFSRINNTIVDVRNMHRIIWVAIQWPLRIVIVDYNMLDIPKWQILFIIQLNLQQSFIFTIVSTKTRRSVLICEIWFKFKLNNQL